MKSVLVALVFVALTAGCSELATTPAEVAEAQVDFARAPAAPRYAPTVIPGLPSSAWPKAINNRGTIVGWYWEDPDAGRQQAFVWQEGEMRRLPDLPGWDRDGFPPPSPAWTGGSAAEDINARGVVVGYAQNVDGYPRAVIWQNEQVMELGTLGGDVSFAVAVNERGDVVGSSETESGDLHAFLWSKGEMIDLGKLPGAEFSRAEGLNNRGTVVGWSAGGLHTQRATLWENDEIVDLGTLQVYESGASDVNNRGQVVGGSIIGTPAVRGVGVIWEHGEIRILGDPAGISPGGGSINERGQVVGTDGGFHPHQLAYLWDRGTITALEERGPLSNAFDINDRGVIVGISEGPVMWSADRSGRGGPGLHNRSPRANNRMLNLRKRSIPLMNEEWAQKICRTRGPASGPPRAIDVLVGCSE